MTDEDPTQRIKSRGYWRVVIRPTRFEDHRVSSLAELEESARSCVVQIRGWDYPHWPRDGTQRMGEFIEGLVDWEDHKELWRLYRTAQFVHLFAMREDWWKDNQSFRQIDVEPGTALSYESTVYSFTEIYLFAGRLATRFKLGPQVKIDISIEGIGERQLQTFDFGRVPFNEERRSRVDRFVFEADYDPEVLVAEGRKLALSPLQRLFELFSWDTTPETLEPIQAKLLESR